MALRDEILRVIAYPFILIVIIIYVPLYYIWILFGPCFIEIQSKFRRRILKTRMAHWFYPPKGRKEFLDSLYVSFDNYEYDRLMARVEPMNIAYYYLENNCKLHQGKFITYSYDWVLNRCYICELRRYNLEMKESIPNVLLATTQLPEEIVRLIMTYVPLYQPQFNFIKPRHYEPEYTERLKRRNEQLELKVKKMIDLPSSHKPHSLAS